MKKMSPEERAVNKEEEAEWEQEVKRLQALLPLEMSCNTAKLREIPRLEQLIKDNSSSLPRATLAKDTVFAESYIAIYTINLPH